MPIAAKRSASLFQASASFPKRHWIEDSPNSRSLPAETRAVGVQRNRIKHRAGIHSEFGGREERVGRIGRHVRRWIECSRRAGSAGINHAIDNLQVVQPPAVRQHRDVGSVGLHRTRRCVDHGHHRVPVLVATRRFGIGVRHIRLLASGWNRSGRWSTDSVGNLYANQRHGLQHRKGIGDTTGHSSPANHRLGNARGHYVWGRIEWSSAECDGHL